jgi:hypothetical protein
MNKCHLDFGMWLLTLGLYNIDDQALQAYSLRFWEVSLTDEERKFCWAATGWRVP